MAVNGRLGTSDLAPIAGGVIGSVPGSGQLRNDAAAAWNALAAEVYRETGVRIRTNGADSAYRSYERQVFWRNWWCSRGRCGNAATPGYSNHGWGTAADVDPATRAVIDRYGARFRWGKTEAWNESWHVNYLGGYSGRDPGPGYGGPAPAQVTYPTLRRGDRGRAVRRAQRHLRRWNVGIARPQVDGSFGTSTRSAVKQFQYVQGLKADGVIGARSWRRLRRKDRLRQDERSHVNRVKLLRRGKEGPKQKRKISFHADWIERRARAIARVAREEKGGWKRENRRERYETLRAAARGRFKRGA